MGPSAELIPFKPNPLQPSDIIGQYIKDISCGVGTYGMGGPGFFGLKIASGQWFVIAIWGAGEWIRLNDRLVEDAFYQKYDRSKPWISETKEELAKYVIGQAIIGCSIEQFSLSLTLKNDLKFIIEEAANRRPLYEGSKKLREFSPNDDLRRAVFLSPTAEIWV